MRRPAAAKFKILMNNIILGKSLSSTSLFGASAVEFELFKIEPATLSVGGARDVFAEDGAGCFRSKVSGSDVGFGGGTGVGVAASLPSSQLGVSPSIFFITTRLELL